MCKRVAQSLIQSVPTVPGVYLIEYLPNNQMYIGFSKNVDEGIRHRISQHFDEFEKGIHTNKKFQEAYTKDSDLDHWSVEVLEVTTDKNRESYWMNVFGVFDSEHDFNKAVPTFYKEHYKEVI